MNFLERLLSVFGRFISVAFTYLVILLAFIMISALTMAVLDLRFSASRAGIATASLYLMMVLAAAVGTAVLRQRLAARGKKHVGRASATVMITAPIIRRRQLISATNIVETSTLRPAMTAHASPAVPALPAIPESKEIYMTEAADVAWVQAQTDPALWHEATMATLAYCGDPHDFLPWVLQQPKTDRATAGWIFLWAEGSRYLRGKTDFPFGKLSSAKMLALFRTICDRSQAIGFTNDNLGLDGSFEAQRLECLAILEDGGIASDVVAPSRLLEKPFDPPCRDPRFMLDDGIIICRDMP